MYRYVLDTLRQPTCMKLGTRELYQPIYTILPCRLPRDIQQICCSAQTEQHEPCIHRHVYTFYMYMYVYLQGSTNTPPIKASLGDIEHIIYMYIRT